MNDQYRQELLRTFNYLLTMHEDLFTRILNVGMNGEYTEINEVFKAGDTFDFELEQFKDTGDTNLTKLVELYEHLEETLNSLENLNNITEDELETRQAEDDAYDMQQLEDLLAAEEDEEEYDLNFDDFLEDDEEDDEDNDDKF